jgi:predicted RNase H-like nuclease (RuvC/YqgF family)
MLAEQQTYTIAAAVGALIVALAASVPGVLAWLKSRDGRKLALQQQQQQAVATKETKFIEYLVGEIEKDRTETRELRERVVTLESHVSELRVIKHDLAERVQAMQATIDLKDRELSMLREENATLKAKLAA